MVDGRKPGVRAPAVLAPLLLGLGLVGAGAGLSGCGSTAKALGMSKVTPDEFRVVTKAPLVVPPDYALRPPNPGEPRPQELQPESQARLALLGARQAQTRTAGESALVAKAGGERADPLIRYVMDDEFGSISHKDKSFSDKLMFWRKGDDQVLRASSADGTTLDPAAEQAKIKSLTGDQAIVIQRAPANKKIKLPGL